MSLVFILNAEALTNSNASNSATPFRRPRIVSPAICSANRADFPSPAACICKNRLASATFAIVLDYCIIVIPLVPVAPVRRLTEVIRSEAYCVEKFALVCHPLKGNSLRTSFVVSYFVASKASQRILE